MSVGEEIVVFLDPQDPEVKAIGLETLGAGMNRMERGKRRGKREEEESLGRCRASAWQAQQGKPACRSAKGRNSFPFKRKKV